jgi:hypothetical protein
MSSFANRNHTFLVALAGNCASALKSSGTPRQAYFLSLHPTRVMTRFPSFNPSDDVVAMSLVSCRHMSFSIFFVHLFRARRLQRAAQLRISCAQVEKCRATRPHTRNPFTGTRLFQDPTGLPNIHATTYFACFSSTGADHTHYACLEAFLRQTATGQQTTRMKEKSHHDSFLRAYHCLHTALQTVPVPSPEPHYNLTVCYQLRLLRDTGQKRNTRTHMSNLPLHVWNLQMDHHV